MRYLCSVFVFCLFPGFIYAQQFIGLQSSQLPSVYKISTNPAFVTEAGDDVQLHLFSASALAGTNAYRINKDSLIGSGGGGLREGYDYRKDRRSNRNKHLWANAEILGPAASFTVKGKHHFGVYTRMREIIRGGNIPAGTFALIGDIDSTALGKEQLFENSGFTAYNFGELGLSYGRVIFDDLYRKVSIGVTVKYLKGMSAGSIYTKETKARINTLDSISSIEGDLSVLYTKDIHNFTDDNAGNDLSSWFNSDGKGSLGLDLGISFEYRADGDPNKRQTPYLYRVDASITDIGGIGYTADTGSGEYQLTLKNQAEWQYKRLDYESYLNYLRRMEKDGNMKGVNEAKDFRIGLPTAFRLNGDYSITPSVYLSCNILLNLKGSSSTVYNPGYVSYISLVPRYETKAFMVALPFTYIGYQSATLGTILRAGPLYIGSSSIISCLLSKELRNADAYLGLAFRLKSHKYYMP